LPADIEWSRTVDRVGERIAAHARRRLPYRFHYVARESFFNAYALPGGHVVFGKGLAVALETEDELAAILGHEIAHVDRYHCAERAQLEAASQRMPLGGLLTLPAAIFKAGYTKDQELEADRHGTTLAVEAGYSPLGAVHAMQMLAKLEPRHDRRASNPLEESGAAGVDSVQEYFKSHPDPAIRVQALEALISSQGWLPSPERALAHGS
jgi:predicted Zn-dependent protease